MNVLRRLFFNFEYLGTPAWDSGISPPELLEFIRTNPPGQALDIGCGTGTNGITLARAGWKVEGIDFAPLAIRIARRKAARAGVKAEFLIDDATQLRRVRGPYHLVLDVGCFHSIDNKHKYLNQLTQILDTNGYWLVYGFLKVDHRRKGPGLVEADLESISKHSFILVSRRNGFDRNERPSVWLTYQYPNSLKSTP